MKLNLLAAALAAFFTWNAQAQDKAPQTLAEAAENGDFAQVKALIKAGADVNAVSDPRDWTALDWAVYKTDLEMVKALLKAGAHVHGRAMEIALREGCIPVARAMLSAPGADLTRRPQTPDFVSLFMGFQGPRSVAREVSQKDTPLLMLTDHQDLLQAMIKAGADVKAKNPKGDTALHYAAAGVLYEIEPRNETWCKAQPRLRQCPLCAQCDCSDPLKRIALLLKAGADIDAQNNQGKTPLMYAAQFLLVDAVRALVKAGADVSLKDKDGKTALELISGDSQAEAQEIQKLLEDAAKKRTKSSDPKRAF